VREELEFECWRSSYTGVSSVQCSAVTARAGEGGAGRVAYAPRSGGDGRKRVEAGGGEAAEGVGSE
jgi:hypothetical protein